MRREAIQNSIRMSVDELYCLLSAPLARSTGYARQLGPLTAVIASGSGQLSSRARRAERALERLRLGQLEQDEVRIAAHCDVRSNANLESRLPHCRLVGAARVSTQGGSYGDASPATDSSPISLR